MKKIFVFTIVAVSVLYAHSAFAIGERIISFTDEITIKPDSSIIISETIQYDFDVAERHGIFRDIPYSYDRNGARYNLRVEVLSVTDGLGVSWPYSESRSGGILSLKIGDANRTISGVQTYVITYSVARAINYFSEHDEFFWNVTGNDWDVPIDAAEASVTLPTELNADQRLSQCFTGLYGSSDSYCGIEKENGAVTVYTADTFLGTGEGLTVVLGWPKGITTPPSASQRLSWFVADNWAVVIPLILVIGMVYVWYSRGRDPKGRKTIIPQYDAPDGLSAGLVGTIVDERADLRDLSATIIQLAVKGYVKIKRLEEKKILKTKVDYEFIKVQPVDDRLEKHEEKIMDAMFGTVTSIRLSALKNKFYTNLPDIKKSMYDRVVEQGYFPTSPEKVRHAYSGVAALIIIIGFSVSFFGNIAAGVLTALLGIIGLFVAQAMPRKTNKGVLAHEHISGFKWFLSVTEKERLKFHNAPEKSPKQFEKFLPYAMALQVEQQWASQFDGMYLTPPDWYEGGSANAFGAVFLATALHDMSSNFSSVAASHPSSAGSGRSGFSGGGFSGGGFGGGGGGSW